MTETTSSLRRLFWLEVERPAARCGTGWEGAGSSEVWGVGEAGCEVVRGSEAGWSFGGGGEARFWAAAGEGFGSGAAVSSQM